jgi:hypothetical protein
MIRISKQFIFEQNESGGALYFDRELIVYLTVLIELKPVIE